MNKITKLMIFTMMMICALAITGCGGSDKFSGTWSNTEKVSEGAGYVYRQICIEKNNDNSYIIKNNIYGYSGEPDRVSGEVWKGNAIYNINYKWINHPLQKGSATLQNNKLVVDGTANLIYFTYIEKDGTLLDETGRTYKKESDKTDGADGIKEFKNSEQKRLLDYTKQFKDKKMPELQSKINEVTFSDKK